MRGRADKEKRGKKSNFTAIADTVLFMEKKDDAKSSTLINAKTSSVVRIIYAGLCSQFI